MIKFTCTYGICRSCDSSDLMSVIQGVHLLTSGTPGPARGLGNWGLGGCHDFAARLLPGIHGRFQNQSLRIISVGAQLTLGGKIFLPENVCMKN